MRLRGRIVLSVARADWEEEMIGVSKSPHWGMVLILAVSPYLAVAQPKSQVTVPAIVKRVAPAVVTIRGTVADGESIGTGFLVTSDGTIATNVHVVSDLKRGAVILSNGERYES